jgi:CRISPR-associated protein Cas2
MTRWLLAYDIADPARLRRVAQVLEDHGCRLQQSVFVCALSDSELDDLRDTLRDRIDPAVDRLVVLPLCERCCDRLEQYGVTTALPGSADALVV